MLEYLKGKYKLIFALLIMAVINSTVFYLYDINIEPIIYALLWSFIILFAVFLLDFLKFKKSKLILKRLQKSVLYERNNLPIASNYIEEQYNILIEKLIENIYEIESKNDNKIRNMDEFYNIWIHQIKTPIAAIKMILESYEGIEETEKVSAMKVELFKIEQYVDMVLSYVRISSSENDYLFKEYNLEHIVNRVIRKFAGQFINKKLKVKINNLDFNVITDEKWLGFIVEQIISNGLKYTKTGGIKIYAKEGILYIEDSGIGIAKEDLPRVFEKGYTGINGRENKWSTGIGLYLVKLTVNKLGHSIKIESELNKGTKVMIDLNTYKFLDYNKKNMATLQK